MCAFVKDEARYLRPWIEYHIKKGFEHFYIYNNDSTDATVEILKEYEKKGIITHIHFPLRPGQYDAYKDCCMRFSHESQWIGFYDIDEYLQCMTNLSIRDFLEKNLGVPAIGIHWAIFGSGGQEKHDPKPDCERFYHRAYKSFFKNQWIKSIVNPRLVERVTDPHFFFYRNNASTLNTELKHIGSVSIETPTWELFRIQHFSIRSKEDFQYKIERGDTLHIPDKPRHYEWGYFRRDDQNQVIDLKQVSTFPQFKTYKIADEINRVDTMLMPEYATKHTLKPSLNWQQYLETYPDLRRFWNGTLRARIHYALFGKNEKRALPISDNTIIIFLHIVKTGGTSFREWLHSNFAKDEVINLYEDNLKSDHSERSFKTKKNIKEYFESLDDCEKERIKCVSGHLVYYGIHKYFPHKRPIYITVVREPLSLVESLYNHIKSRISKEKTPLFVDWVKTESPLCKYFCDFFGIPHHYNEQSLRQIITNIRKHVYILHTETLSENVSSLKRQISMLQSINQIPELNTRVGVHNKENIPITFLSPEDINSALPYLKSDIELYKKIIGEIS